MVSRAPLWQRGRLATALCALALWAGCSGDSQGTDPPAQDGGKSSKTTESKAPAGEEPRDTLVVAFPQDMQFPLSVIYEGFTDGEIQSALNFPMIDFQFDCSLKKEPGLIESWEWSPDGTSIKMKVRKGMKWSDGTPVTAKDIAFAYELAADPAVGSPRGPHTERIKGKVPVVSGDYDIEFQFTEAYDRDTQISHAAIDPVPLHALQNADRGSLRGNPYTKKPLSDGPFKLTTYEPNNRIVLEVNDQFSGPPEWRPKIKRIIVRVIPDYATRLIELQKGGIDLMDAIEIADADLVRENNKNIRLYRRGWRAMDYVGWNLQNPLFKDKKLRKALAMSINEDEMIARLLTAKDGEVYARRSVGTITPALCGVHNDDIQPLPFAPEQAKQLFAEAGWTDSDRDGYLDKGGKRLEFTLTTNQGVKLRNDTAVLLNAQWKAVGVMAKIERLETNAFYEKLRKRDFEAALAGWEAALFVDPSAMWHSDTPGQRREFNFTGYSNPAADALIEKGLKTPVPQDAIPVWKELQAIVYEDQPYLFLWWKDEIVAVDGRFENVGINEMGVLNGVHAWSVPKDKVKYQR